MRTKTITFSALFLALFAHAASSAPITYPIGVWGSLGVLEQGNKVSQGLIDNKGLVGLGVSEDWDIIQLGPDTFDWSSLDNKIALTKAAGFNYIALSIVASSNKTPQWLLDSLPPEDVIYLRDPGEGKDSYCEEIRTAVYWSPAFHAARLNLIAKAGERYAGDPAIVAVIAQFANHNSNDWNINDTIGTIGPCSDGKTYDVNQPMQWIDAGWTIQKMFDVGTQILDATAAAFPNQAIKHPIGGLADDLVIPFLGPDSGYGSLADMIVNYAEATSYADRFYPQRNTVDANWGDATTLNPPNEPDIQSIRYPKLLVWTHTRPDGATPKQGGLQMVASASQGATTQCRQNGGPDGPCGPSCDPLCVLQASLDVALTFNTSFTEIWPQDAMNPDLYSVIEGTTLAMGGQLRDDPFPPTITKQPVSKKKQEGRTVNFSVTATGSAPMSYQWQKNGTNIAFATQSSYTTPKLTMADDGAVFTVVVTNSVTSVTSNGAVLDVWHAR